jgi:hypothetical protein
MSGTKAPDPIGKPQDADMVGYSRLCGLDDTETLERLQARAEK